MRPAWGNGMKYIGVFRDTARAHICHPKKRTQINNIHYNRDF